MSDRPSLVITNKSLTESALAAALGRGGMSPYLFKTLHAQVVTAVAVMPKRMPGFVRRHGGPYISRIGSTDIVISAKVRGLEVELRQDQGRVVITVELFQGEYIGRISEIEALFQGAGAMLTDLAAGWPSTKKKIL